MKPVESAYGVAAALRDLLNKAGDGEQLNGRLEGALADAIFSDGNPEKQQLYLTVGTRRFTITVTETSRGNAETDS